jgi:FMN reductase [NAD(P)H]
MPSHHGYKEKKDGAYANDTMKLLMERASCRNFADQKIPKKVLDSILDAGTHAATGGNLQPYSIIKIDSLATREKLATMCHQGFIAKAPVSLVFCIDWHRLQRWAELETAPFSATSSFRHFWISFQDTIICAQNICTAADALGLGSVYIGTIMEFFRETRDMLELPKGVFPVVLLCIGYSKGMRMVRRKLGKDVIVHDEKYHELGDEDLRKAFDEKYHHVKIEMTEERLEKIHNVCTKVHGTDFAARCIERIKRAGYINAAQRYFGLHYEADLMPEGNEDFVAITKELGFNWFEKFEQEG